MFRKSLLDKAWAGHAFLAPPSSLTDEVNNRRRYYTTSSRKFTDTTLGGHFVMNPLSQFTGTADLKHKSIYSESKGEGRWYAENLDDNYQIIHIRAGVPKFNSMATFFTNFYNVHAGSVARTGRGPDVWFRVGQVAGVIGTIPFQPFVVVGSAIKFFFGMPRSKYYYLKPTMYPYWFAVGSMVNGIMVNLGMTPHFLTNEQRRYFDPVTHAEKPDYDAMRRIYGDVLLKGGGIDIFAISTKAQRLATAYREAMASDLDGMSDDPVQRTEELNRLLLDGIDRNLSQLRDPGASLAEYEKAYLAFLGAYDESKAGAGEADDNTEGWWAQAAEAFGAERRMGADFVTFRVSHTGTQSENFSNQTGESSLQSEINNMSSSARSARFNLADGNITSVIGTVVDAVKSVGAGILDSVAMEGFMVLGGQAFADIQKTYESSSADLNRTTFTIPLRAWAADDWVRLKNLFLPLASILCLGLPRATGPGSYDGPFLLEVFNQGRTQIREGMIESISIERGVGDVGWGRGSKVLGIDVNVTIVDLSTILSVPINPAVGGVAQSINVATAVAGEATGNGVLGSLGEAGAALIAKNTYSEDNKYTDYLATLASLPLESQINISRKWKLAMARSRIEMGQWRSPHHAAAKLMDVLPGELIKAVSAPTDRY